jgi:predicted secreted protein with PEFG-CTERM motif
MIVSVDKTSYGVGETVMVSGRVPTVLEGETVAIQVFNPRGVMYTIAQVTPEADRSFSTSVKIGGSLGIAGIYTVKATYLGQTTQTTFDFTGGPGGLTVSGIRIDASLSNGSISRIQVDQDFNSLIIMVRTSADNDGTLTITLPREVIDAKLNGGDDEFIVLVDGEEVAYEETNTTATSRTLSIPVPAGSSEIEIIGTHVIPEFGIIAALVLAVAVGAIIIISRKNQILNILPR